MADSTRIIQSKFLEHDLRETSLESNNVKSSVASNSDFVPPKSKEARDQYTYGNWSLDARNYSRAIEAYRRASEIEPNCAAIYYRLGLAHYKEGDFDFAKDAFQKAIALNPVNPSYHYVLGQLLQDWHDLEGASEAAIDEFTKTIDQDPSFIEALYDRALLYDKLGEFEKACADFKRVIAQKPHFYAGRHNLGVLYIKRQMWGEAKKAFEDILEMEPGDSDAYYHLAEVYLNSSKDIDMAIDALSRAIQHAPDHLDAHFTIGLIYAQNRYNRPGFRQKAIDAFIQLIKINETLQAFDQLDQVFFILGSLYDDDPKEATRAISAYQAGLEHSSSAPAAAQVRNNLGLLYLQKDQVDQAAEEFRQAIQLNPEYEAPYHNLAKLYFYERDEDLLADLQQWLTRDPEISVGMIFQLALSLMDVARAEAHQNLYSRLHRVKNLMSVSGVQLRSVLRQADPSSALQDALSRIFTQQEESYNEMVSILRLLRMEGPRFGLVDLNKILEALRRETEAALEAKGIICQLDLQPHLPPVRGDSSQLKEAFHNLIINAIDAMENGGSLRIQTLYRSQPSQVQISFTDTGTGIPNAVQSQIYQPGYTLKHNGNGFGLDIVQRTVHSHKGQIDLDSKEGRGTTFAIYLPVNPEAAPIRTNLQMRPIFYEARHDLAFEELV